MGGEGQSEKAAELLLLSRGDIPSLGFLSLVPSPRPTQLELFSLFFRNEACLEQVIKMHFLPSETRQNPAGYCSSNDEETRKASGKRNKKNYECVL
jgi:hypothetical protein